MYDLPSHASLWPGGLEAVPQCPLCGESRRTVELDKLSDETFGAAPGTWISKRCLGCGVMYLDPRPDPASIHLAYRNYYTHDAQPVTPHRGLLARARNVLGNSYRNRLFGTDLHPSLPIAGWIAPLFRKTAARIRQEDRGLGGAHGVDRRLLDVGCGRGEFILWARQLGWRCYGVEIDGAAAALARQCGGEILGSRVQEVSRAHDVFFDAITLSHVIEHVYDPLDLLGHCWRLLRPGGYLWIETPNSESVGYEVYGRHWRGLEPPRHLVLFNTSALRMSLERTGFERARTLEPRDAAGRLFLLSEAMRNGLIAERDQYVLAPEAVAHATATARRARAATRRDPRRSEFVTMVAYRPPAGK